MLPRNLHTSLTATLFIGFATLVRSVAYDRWITVLASLLLMAGAAAALRGRTWGVVLSFASAAAFPIAFAIGIAPSWFVGVGIIGALPFLFTSEALARLDQQATALLAFIAAGAGALGAIAWKLLAWDVFRTFPALWPSRYPQHGLAVTALLAIAVVAVVMRGRSFRRQQLRIASGDRARVGDVAQLGRSADTEAEAYEEERVPIRRQHHRG